MKYNKQFVVMLATALSVSTAAHANCVGTSNHYVCYEHNKNYVVNSFVGTTIATGKYLNVGSNFDQVTNGMTVTSHRIITDKTNNSFLANSFTGERTLNGNTAIIGLTGSVSASDDVFYNNFSNVALNN